MMKTVQIAPLTTLKERAARLALGLGLATTLAFGAVLPALAAEGEVILQAGTSSVQIADFSFNSGGAVALSGGANQTTTATPSITVVDASGSSQGWEITLSASAFENAGATKTLVASPRVTGATVNGATNSVSSYAGGISINGTNVIAGATAAQASNGTHVVTPTVEIDIPADTEIDNYTSTFTVSFVQAP
jgi:hypothetical protein